jgi:hypothetical protein
MLLVFEAFTTVIEKPERNGTAIFNLFLLELIELKIFCVIGFERIFSFINFIFSDTIMIIFCYLK